MAVRKHSVLTELSGRLINQKVLFFSKGTLELFKEQFGPRLEVKQSESLWFPLSSYTCLLNLKWQSFIQFKMTLTAPSLCLYANYHVWFNKLLSSQSIFKHFALVSACVAVLIKYSDIFLLCVWHISAVQPSGATSTYHPCLCLLLWFKLGLNEETECATIIIQGWLGALI